MTSVNALKAWPPAVRLTPRTVLEAWGGITRRELWVTFLLGCALFLLGFAIGITRGAGIRALPFFFAGAQIRAFTLLLAFAIADKVTGGDPDRRWAYALAVVVGAVVAAFLSVAFVEPMLNWFVFPKPIYPGVGFRLYVALDLMMIGGAAVWVILDRRRAAGARERMHGAELDRIAAEKSSIESDLQAMQARVEPQFLFNTLAQVHDLYRADATRGEHMLDDLIAYLRAAMPLMRDTSSTVGQEIELVRAYLGIVQVRLGDRLTYEIDLHPEAEDVRMPPMMLLPLVDHAVSKGLQRSEARGAIRITAATSDGRVRLIINDSGVGFLPEGTGDGIAGIRERLAALYGENARLDLRRAEAHATEAVLEIPVEAGGSAAELSSGIAAFADVEQTPHIGPSELT